MRWMGLAVSLALAVACLPAPPAEAAALVCSQSLPCGNLDCEILTIGGFPPEPNPDLDCLEPGSSPPHEAPSASAGNETEGDP